MKKVFLTILFLLLILNLIVESGISFSKSYLLKEKRERTRNEVSKSVLYSSNTNEIDIFDKMQLLFKYLP